MDHVYHKTKVLDMNIELNQDKMVDTDFDGYRYRDPTSSELIQIRKNRLEARKIELEQELVTINAQLHNIGKL